MRRAFAVSSADDAPLTELQTDSFPVALVIKRFALLVCAISQGPGVCFVLILEGMLSNDKVERVVCGHSLPARNEDFLGASRNAPDCVIMRRVEIRMRPVCAVAL